MPFLAKIGAAIAAIILSIGAFVGFTEEPLGAVQPLHALETFYKAEHDRYLQVRCDGTLVNFLGTETERTKWEKAVDGFCVSIYKEPESRGGEWGYTVKWEDEDNKYSDGVGPLKTSRDYTILKPEPYDIFATTTPRSSWKFPTLSWLVETVSAAATQTHTADLERDDSEFFSHANTASLELADTSFTISVWLNFETAPPTSPFEQHLPIDMFGTSPQRNYRLSINNNEVPMRVDFQMHDGSDATQNQFVTNFVAGEWWNLIVVFDKPGDTVSFFVNGAPTSTPSTNTRVIGATTAEFDIGADFNGANSFDGKIDDVRIWSRALSTSTISTYFDDPCTFDNGANLVGEWLFNNSPNDTSGNGLDLTEENTIVYQTASLPYTCAEVAAGDFLFGVGF